MGFIKGFTKVLCRFYKKVLCVFLRLSSVLCRFFKGALCVFLEFCIGSCIRFYMGILYKVLQRVLHRLS